MSYALAMPGKFYRSKDGLRNFEKGPKLFAKYQQQGSRMRHSAVMKKDGELLVFYSNIGDNPESILLSTISLDQDWTQWEESEPVLVLKPETKWEGVELPLMRSDKGPAKVPVNQLRDPAIFIEDGRTYMLYSISGEQGIAIAEIKWEK